MNVPSDTFPPPRVVPHPWHAFGGIWRLTVRRMLMPGHWLAVGGMLVALVVLSIPALPNREAAADGYLRWVIAFYVTFLVPIMAFISAASAVREDIKGGTVDYIFTRPIRRREFLGFKYLAHMACAQLDFLIAFAVVLALGLRRDTPDLWAPVPMLLLAQMLVVAVFTAFGFLCGIVTSRYVILGLAYGAVVEVGVGQIPTSLNKFSMIHQVRAMLQPLVDQATLVPPAPGPVATMLLLLVVSVGILAVAAVIFSFQELCGPGET